MSWLKSYGSSYNYYQLNPGIWYDKLKVLAYNQEFIVFTLGELYKYYEFLTKHYEKHCRILKEVMKQAIYSWQSVLSMQ